MARRLQRLALFFAAVLSLTACAGSKKTNLQLWAENDSTVVIGDVWNLPDCPGHIQGNGDSVVHALVLDEIKDLPRIWFRLAAEPTLAPGSEVPSYTSRSVKKRVPQLVPAEVTYFLKTELRRKPVTDLRFISPILAEDWIREYCTKMRPPVVKSRK